MSGWAGGGTVHNLHALPHMLTPCMPRNPLPPSAGSSPAAPRRACGSPQCGESPWRWWWRLATGAPCNMGQDAAGRVSRKGPRPLNLTHACTHATQRNAGSKVAQCQGTGDAASSPPEYALLQRRGVAVRGVARPRPARLAHAAAHHQGDVEGGQQVLRNGGGGACRGGAGGRDMHLQVGGMDTRSCCKPPRGVAERGQQVRRDCGGGACRALGHVFTGEWRGYEKLRDTAPEI